MPAIAAARRRRSPTRELILDQAERLIAVKGVFGFTLSDVAKPLGVRVPAIYKHYTSRDDMLVEVARRFVTLLAAQFAPDKPLQPGPVLRRALDEFVTFMMSHPAYVRLALVDLATPGGGMEYVTRAAGGSFEENFSGGPLAAMYARLRNLLRAGSRSKDFRAVDATSFYRLVYASLLSSLVFPNDTPLIHAPTPLRQKVVQRALWDVATAYLAPRPTGRYRPESKGDCRR